MVSIVNFYLVSFGLLSELYDLIIAARCGELVKGVCANGVAEIIAKSAIKKPCCTAGLLITMTE
jgi:hypothetical protein